MELFPTIEKWNLISDEAEKDKIKMEIASYLNHLILNDFNGLLQILYRVDIPEDKLRFLLSTNKTTDASELLTELLLQRQSEKIKSRNSTTIYKDIPDEDRW